jgi:hypothetical protein
MSRLFSIISHMVCIWLRKAVPINACKSKNREKVREREREREKTIFFYCAHSVTNSMKFKIFTFKYIFSTTFIFYKISFRFSFLFAERSSQIHDNDDDKVHHRHSLMLTDYRSQTMLKTRHTDLQFQSFTSGETFSALRD